MPVLPDIIIGRYMGFVKQVTRDLPDYWGQLGEFTYIPDGWADLHDVTGYSSEGWLFELDDDEAEEARRLCEKYTGTAWHRMDAEAHEALREEYTSESGIKYDIDLSEINVDKSFYWITICSAFPASGINNTFTNGLDGESHHWISLQEGKRYDAFSGIILNLSTIYGYLHGRLLI